MKKSLSRQITVYFLIILLLTAVVSAAWNYFSTRQSILDMEKSQAEGCTQTVSNMLEHYGTAALYGDRNAETYRFIRNATRNFCMGFRQDVLYLYTVDDAAQRRNVLLAVANDKELNSRLVQENTELPNDSLLKKAEEAVLSGRETLHREEWKTPYGTVFAWLAMLRDPVSADPILICMEYNIELEQGHILRDFLEDILLPITALGLAFLAMILLIRRRITAPIRLISNRMESFARDSSHRPEPLNIRSEDEIGEIASSFEKMTADISTYVNNIEKLTQERVETDVQLDIARRIQNGLVPEKTCLKGRGYSISAMTRPAKGVGGGNFYDCFRREGDSMCIVMGDVSGKGITGALFMAVIKTMIREKLMAGLRPAETLNQANMELMAQNPEGLFATVFAAVLDPGTGELRYANAGHTYPVLMGEVPGILKPANGIALGMYDDAEIVDETMTLAPGQGFFLYTDGVTEALNPQHEQFGMERLVTALADDPQRQETAEEILLRVSSAVGTYCAGVEPFDDMAILVLLMTEGSGKENFRTVPVSLSSFEAVREAVFAEAGDTPETRKALLACDEALSNIVRYSGATELSFQCIRQENSLCVTFQDNGIAFDPTAVQPEDKEFELLDSGGMGLNLIRQTVSSARYERQNGMNRFSLVFPCPAGDMNT